MEAFCPDNHYINKIVISSTYGNIYRTQYLQCIVNIP